MKRYPALLSVVVVVLIQFLGFGALAQRPDVAFSGRRAMPDFQIDWSQFRADDPTQTRLEVYYRIPNSGLSFRKVDTGFEASYELRIAVVRDNETVDKREFKRRLFVKDYSRTKLYNDFVLNETSFDLLPEKYDVEATLIDRLTGQNNLVKVETKLSAFAGSKYPQLSGIEILRAFNPNADSAAYFRKGEAVAVPSVNRLMQGSEEGGPLLFYFELYPGKKADENILIDTRIKSRRSGLVYRDTVYVRTSEPISRQMRSVSLSDFAPGEYSLSVDIYVPRKNKPVFSRSESFEVSWSLLAMVKHDYDALLGQLEHIATAEEYSALKAAETPKSRLAAWRDFWLGRDPTPDSDENEARVSFYTRVRYANQNFTTQRREGWRSDRGMILLRYGFPDEAIDEPVSPDVGAYQIWYYYNFAGEPLRFVFVDEYGDEDFRLQYPYDGRY